MCDLQRVLLYLDLISSLSVSFYFYKIINRIIMSGKEVIRKRSLVLSCGLKISVI